MKGKQAKRRKHLRLGRMLKLNPVKAYRRRKAVRFAGGLRARYKNEHAIESEAKRLNELAEAFRDPYPILRINVDPRSIEREKEPFRSKTYQQFYPVETGLIYYRFLLEGEALEGNPGLLRQQMQETKMAMEKAMRLMRKEKRTRFEEEAMSLWREFTGNSPLKHHPLFENPDAFNAVSGRILLDFLGLRSQLGRTEDRIHGYMNVAVMRWHQHFVNSKVVQRIEELMRLKKAE